MANRSQFLQIRVTPAQKDALRGLAEAAGASLSTYVLGRALPAEGVQTAEIMEALRDDAARRPALAALHDLLTAAPPERMDEILDIATSGIAHLPPLSMNLVAALLEEACMSKRVKVPRWLRDIPALDEPYFASPLPGLRQYLLRASPVAYRRRNLFVDTGLGGRV